MLELSRIKDMNNELKQELIENGYDEFVVNLLVNRGYDKSVIDALLSI